MRSTLRFGVTTVLVTAAVTVALAFATNYPGSTLLSASPNPATLGAGNDVTLSTTTSSTGGTALIDTGKIQYKIATDGTGNLVSKDYVGVITWVQVNAGGGISPSGGVTSLALDLDNLSSLVTGLHNASCGDVIGFYAHYVTGGGSDKVATHDSSAINVTVTCSCRAVEEGDAFTRSQGFYGNDNGGAFLDAEVPGGLTVGIGYTLTFTDSAAIQAFMSTNPAGTPGQLTGSHVDPTATESGIFGHQVTALKLNVEYYDAIAGNGDFGSLVFHDATSAFDGMTVAQILAAAETALGGGALLNGTTIGGSDNNSYEFVVDQLNLAFDNDLGTPSSWALLYLTFCG